MRGAETAGCRPKAGPQPRCRPYRGVANLMSRALNRYYKKRRSNSMFSVSNLVPTQARQVRYSTSCIELLDQLYSASYCAVYRVRRSSYRRGVSASAERRQQLKRPLACEAQHCTADMHDLPATNMQYLFLRSPVSICVLSI